MMNKQIISEEQFDNEDYEDYFSAVDTVQENEVWYSHDDIKKILDI